MKKIFLLVVLLILLAISASAWNPCVVTSGKKASVCDDCSGDLKFAWHMEDLDITADNPCGCSDGDTTGTIVGSAAISGTQYYDGNESLYSPGNTSYVSFTISSDDIFDDTDFKIKIWIYIDTFALDSSVLHININADNRFTIWVGGDSANIDIGFTYKHGGTVDYIVVNCNRVEDEWIYVECKAKVDVAGNDIYLNVCDSDGVSNCVTATEDDDLVAMGNGTVLMVGEGYDDGTGAVVYIGKLEIYGTSGF